ncbi:hypothetical protein BGX38DRAFT_1278775 [Terfezia claveryi]|nr:hypothetical protein BGX38DRAFT_1278775 [Terfezia claveryi]
MDKDVSFDGKVKALIMTMRKDAEGMSRNYDYPRLTSQPLARKGDHSGKSPGVELATHGRRGIMEVTSVSVDRQGARTRKDYGRPYWE